MKTEIDIITQLGQDENQQTAGSFLNEILLGVIRNTLFTLMAQEVAELCGASHSRNNTSEYQRAGSAPSTLQIGDEQIRRPRVRQKDDQGGTKEIILDSYKAAQQQQAEELKEQIIRSYLAGVSTRDMPEATGQINGTSSSQVSRIWTEEGAKQLKLLTERDLSQDTWVAVMIDGIVLSKDLTATVALGFTSEGEKKILGFKIGSSENLEVCKDLLRDLVERGFGPQKGYRLLSVLDGSKALSGAVREFWPDALIQRCLVHKERNIKGKLSHRHHGEVARLFKELRLAQGEEDGKKAYEALHKFLKKTSAEALASLEEAGEEEMLAIHRLNIPNTLHKTFLSTNCIENSFKNVRRKTGRVNRWRPETHQASYWMAYALSVAEKGFRKIHGYKEIGLLLEALKKEEK